MDLFEPLEHRSLVDDFCLLTLTVARLELERQVCPLIPILLVVRGLADREIGVQLLLGLVVARRP